MHATTDTTRNKLIKNNPCKISELFKALDYFSQKDHKMINIYYNLIKGVNDSKSDADKLTNLIGTRPILVYLKKLCGNENTFSKKSYIQDLEKFRKMLDKNNIASFIMLSCVIKT